MVIQALTMTGHYRSKWLTDIPFILILALASTLATQFKRERGPTRVRPNGSVACVFGDAVLANWASNITPVRGVI
jgi:hypothetical protein